MISFAPEDDEKQLASAAQRFALAELRPHLRAHEKARALPDAVQACFHGLGLIGLDLPEALGFGGLPLLTRALVEEELGAGDAGASVALDAVGPAGQLITALGTPGQQAAFLRPFLDDPRRAAALGAAESSPGPDFATTATSDGDAYVLRGEKLAWEVGTQISNNGNRIVDMGGTQFLTVGGGGQAQNRVGFGIADFFMYKVKSATIDANGTVLTSICDGGTGKSGLEMGGRPGYVREVVVVDAAQAQVQPR